MMNSKSLMAIVAVLVMAAIAVVIPPDSAIASATSPMSELTRIDLPGSGNVVGAAVSPDDTRLYVGRGQTVYAIDTATNLVIATVVLTLPYANSYILDLDVSSDGTRLFVISNIGSPSTQIDVLSTSTLASVVPTFTSTIDGERLDVPRDDPDHFVISGANGWVQHEQDGTVSITKSYYQPDQVRQGTVSHDGTRIYGQSLLSNQANGFEIGSGFALSSYIFGDSGGGMHYTSVNGDPAADRVLLFAGGNSTTQDSFVLDRDSNHVQTLGVPGITYGTEGVDGETVVVSQNRGTTDTQNGGLSVIKLIKHPTNGWIQGQKLVLDDLVVRNAGDIATAASIGRYYVANVLGGEVIVIEDGVLNNAPDCSNAAPSKSSISKSNKKMHEITITDVTDPNSDPISIIIDAISQDEIISGQGNGNSTPDGAGIGTSSAFVKAERDGDGDGRVYEIDFTASDGNDGTCTGTVFVEVLHDNGKKADAKKHGILGEGDDPKKHGKLITYGTATNSGTIYDSTVSL